MKTAEANKRKNNWNATVSAAGKTFECNSMRNFLSGRAPLSRTGCAEALLLTVFAHVLKSALECYSNRSYPGQTAGIFIIMGHAQWPACGRIQSREPYTPQQIAMP